MKKPFFGILYGPSGTGKTLGCIRAFPEGVFLGLPGGTNSASFLGLEVPIQHMKSIKEIVNGIKANHRTASAIIVDDLSVIGKTELQACRKTHKGWSAYDAFNLRMYELKDVARSAQCPVIFTMHQQAPKTVTSDAGNKRLIPGAPLIPGWQLPEELPQMTDFLAHVVYDSNVVGWPYVLQTGPDDAYLTKDRLNISPPRFSMCLRPMLQLAGYDVQLPKDLQWIEPLVEKLATKLQPLLKETNADALQQFLAGVSVKLKSHDPRHIRWVLMDAIDRAYLLNHKESLLDSFIKSMTTINIGDDDEL